MTKKIYVRYRMVNILFSANKMLDDGVNTAEIKSYLEKKIDEFNRLELRKDVNMIYD